MKVSKRTIIISSIVIAFVLGVIATVSIIKISEDKQKKILKISPDHVDLQIKDFVYTEVGEADSKWEVKAQSAKYYKKQNLALFERVQIKLTTAEGKTYVMTGDKGQMCTDVKNIEIRGKVVIMSDTGDKFQTDYLKYNNAERKFYTDAPVTMENKKMKMTGVGLTLFMNTGKLNLSSLVKARIN